LSFISRKILMRSSITSASSVAVIGAGAMGAGIAQVAAAAGHSVKLYDMHVPAAQKAIDNIRGNYQRLVVKNRMSADQAEAAGKRLSIAEGLEALSGTVLVIEAIAENRRGWKHCPGQY
jgi:3-hydroxybutyryl-CoA dehydrogenase